MDPIQEVADINFTSFLSAVAYCQIALDLLHKLTFVNLSAVL